MMSESGIKQTDINIDMHVEINFILWALICKQEFTTITSRISKQQPFYTLLFFIYTTLNMYIIFKSKFLTVLRNPQKERIRMATTFTQKSSEK